MHGGLVRVAVPYPPQPVFVWLRFALLHLSLPRALRALFAPFGPFKFIPWDDDIDLSIDTSKSGGKVKVYSQYPVLV